LIISINIVFINLLVNTLYKNIITQGEFLSTILITIGLFGLLINKNSFLIVMMSLELALLGLILNFSFVSLLFKQPSGQVVALFIISMAAIESAIGLSLIIAFNHFFKTININEINFASI
jgi:NADH:ubiquinone oxidoreductase subunit K